MAMPGTKLTKSFMMCLVRREQSNRGRKQSRFIYTVQILPKVPRLSFASPKKRCCLRGSVKNTCKVGVPQSCGQRQSNVEQGMPPPP